MYFRTQFGGTDLLLRMDRIVDDGVVGRLQHFEEFLVFLLGIHLDGEEG